jgi:glycosyltransferase involved in cell wall biosynthesis
VGTTKNSSNVRLLDLSRTVARAGRVPSGIDRVERAYLRELLSIGLPFYGLIRTRLGYLLLDMRGAAALLSAVDSGAPQEECIACARAVAVARSPRVFLGRLLRRRFPSGLAYINVGHSNLTRRVLRAVKSTNGGTATILLHDMIPLDFPQLQRKGRAREFARRMRRVSRLADQVVCISSAARERVAHHLARFGRVPPILTAPIGAEIVPPDGAALPPDLDLSRPYFVAIGTIEPRKNIGFLLDLWSEMDSKAPRLFICGSRGWGCEDVFDRLDAGVANVTEIAGLPDPALSALLSGASALLFPSLAEGFGLPPVEAAALGVPVIANDLPSLREILGNRAVYLDVSDPYSWIDVIKAHEQSPPERGSQAFDPPRWEAHFKMVFTVT